jgi:hypothetical protein
MFKGLSHQQYTISAANKLADFLNDMLTICKCQVWVLAKETGQGQNTIARYY